MDELDHTLRLKFDRTIEDRNAIQARLLETVTVIVPTIEINGVPDDPDDNIVLECAVEGIAGYIVSGDRHLLMLGAYQSIPILKVREFLDRIER